MPRPQMLALAPHRRSSRLTPWIALAWAACSSAPPAWKVPTDYEIHDVSMPARAKIEQAIRANDPTLYHVSTMRLGGEREAMVFTLTDIADMEVLSKVQETIQAVSHGEKVPVSLQHAALVFASVYGDGTASIQLRGSATRGARVSLDLGDTVQAIEASVDPEGAWTATVNNSQKLGERGGWVYGVIRKGNVEQFIRVNVLGSQGSQNIARDELPADSVLRR